ncbi:MAG TPA: hypothetical protein EYN91_22495 [Candidatus Melainabacteria bacterium]|jgi:hypothetical protein|nr:hypothetical protein [Candidatus Melainabacteria bacterium]HIN67380.1 hypothetical protein [Candidatus Obscuribacterales bacterium]
MRTKQLPLILLLCLISSAFAASADEQKNKSTEIINSSLGAIGQCVVLTVSSAGAKTEEYHAKIPNDMYSPDGDNTALGLIEIGKRVTDGINKAKKLQGPTTITIRIETKVPDSQPSSK